MTPVLPHSPNMASSSSGHAARGHEHPPLTVKDVSKMVKAGCSLEEFQARFRVGRFNLARNGEPMYWTVSNLQATGPIGDWLRSEEFEHEYGALPIAPLKLFLDAYAKGDRRHIDRMLPEHPEWRTQPLEVGSSTALHEASRGGQLELVKELVPLYSSVDVMNYEDETPLCLACYRGHLGVAEYLLGLGASVSPFGQRKTTALHGAGACGDERIIKLLLDHGAEINAADDSGATPLYRACERLRYGSIRLLVEHGADVRVASRSGMTALHEVCRGSDASIVGLLIDHGADVNAATRDGKTPLHSACLFCHESVVRLLLEHGADVNAIDRRTCEPPVYGACREGSLPTVRLLCEHGAKLEWINSYRQSALGSALDGGHLEVVKYLMDERGARLDNLGSPPKEYWESALGLGDIPTVRFLAEKGVYGYCLSQVMDAVKRKHEAMVRFLMLRAEISDEELMSVDVQRVPEPLRASIERHPGGLVEWRRREWSHDVRFFLLAWRRSVVMQGLSSS